MHTYNPRYAQVFVAIVALLVLFVAPVSGAVTLLNSEARATVDRVVAGMIADTMKKGYRQPPVSIALVACTYGETGERSEYSIWLEATIKEVLPQQEGLGVMAKGVAEDLPAPQQENYKAFSQRTMADWMLRGNFVEDGTPGQVKVTLELVDLATSQVLMLRSLSTGTVYHADGRAIVVPPKEAPPETWVQIRVLPEGQRADLKILNLLGQVVKQYADSEGEQEKLAPGRYRLEAMDRLGQYYPYTQDFVVAQAKVRLEASLKPRFGSLELRVKPAAGVEVAVNGRKEEATGPGLWVVEGLKAGKYEVAASKEMYRTERREVEVKEGERTRVDLVLEENKYRLEVAGGGQIGGKVIVNGVARGNLPVSLELPFGRTRVRVEPADDRYQVWEKDVDPKVAGGVERVSVMFVERTGTVEITTNPAAEASLRARERGGTWREIGSAPMDWKAIVGEYEVEGQAVIKDQARSGVERVTIRENQVSRVRIQLTTSTTSTTTIKKDAKAELGNAMEMTLGGAQGVIGSSLYVPIYLFMPLPLELPAEILGKIPPQIVPPNTVLYSADARQRAFRSYYDLVGGVWKLKAPVALDQREPMWWILEDAGFDPAKADYKAGRNLAPVVVSFTITKDRKLVNVEMLQSSGDPVIDESVIYGFRRAAFWNKTGEQITGKFTYRF